MNDQVIDKIYNPIDARRDEALEAAIKVLIEMDKHREEWATLSYKLGELGGGINVNPTLLEDIYRTHANILSGCIGDAHIVNKWLRKYQNLPEVEGKWVERS